MKKWIYFFGMVIPVFGFSQSHTKGTLFFNANFDGGVHVTVAQVYYQNTWVDQDTSTAATTLFRLDAQYNILQWLFIF